MLTFEQYLLEKRLPLGESRYFRGGLRDDREEDDEGNRGNASTPLLGVSSRILSSDKVGCRKPSVATYKLIGRDDVARILRKDDDDVMEGYYLIPWSGEMATQRDIYRHACSAGPVGRVESDVIEHFKKDRVERILDGILCRHFLLKGKTNVSSN